MPTVMAKSESRALRCLTRLCQIVAAWHEREYWLGDIKPSNIVFDLEDSPQRCPSATHVDCTGCCPRLFVIDLESVVSNLKTVSALLPCQCAALLRVTVHAHVTTHAGVHRRRQSPEGCHVHARIPTPGCRGSRQLDV